MDTKGRHLLVEYRGCPAQRLSDRDTIEALMESAARAAKATIVRSVFHAFAPHGVTGVVVLMESHLSIHTWPEHGYAAVDFYTCGDCAPEHAVDLLFDGLNAATLELLHVERGCLQSPRAIAPAEHLLRERRDVPTEAREVE